LLRPEGLRLTDLYAWDRSRVRQDILPLLGLLFISGPVTFLPNQLLATWLFGSAEAPLALMLQPLPLWAAVFAGVLFPITIALTELPMYYGYVRPRLEVLWQQPWAAVAVAVFWHAAQHTALPLLFDWRFAAWRLGMFLPFALLVALVLRWRPSLMPYMMVVHGLMDLSMVFLNQTY
jgi:hypothetical protein